MSDILTASYKQPESNVRKKLKKLFLSWGMFAQNIETGSTELGVPDMWVGYQKGYFWAELKSIAAPKRASTLIRPGLRPEQVAWAEKFKKHKTTAGKWFLIVAISGELYYSTVPRTAYKKSELKKFENILKELN